MAPAGSPCAPGELLVPAPGLEEDEVAPAPSASIPCSMSLIIGTLSSFAHLLRSCRPIFFFFGGATTPTNVAVPGTEGLSRPSLARQRGALRPKSGTEACIGSSFFPLFMEGWSGKSCIVRGTPIRRALMPASLMSAALCVARSTGVACSIG